MILVGHPVYTHALPTTCLVEPDPILVGGTIRCRYVRRVLPLSGSLGADAASLMMSASAGKPAHFSRRGGRPSDGTWGAFSLRSR